MNKKWLIAGLLLIGGIAFMFWWSSDKNVIERRTNAILDAFHFEEDDKGVALGEKLSENLAKTVSFRKPEDKFRRIWRSGDGNVIHRENAVAAHRTIQEYSRYGKVTNRKVEILKVGESEATVSVKFHLEIKAKSGSLGRSTDEDFDCIFKFKKEEGAWLLSSVEIK